MISNDYICPRCNYRVGNKTWMSRHFQRKTLCKNNNNLTLTPEIINIVLVDRIYYPNTTTTNNPNGEMNLVINNYNTINNLVVQMDCQDKINKLAEYTGVMTLDFEDRLDEQFNEKENRLKLDDYKYGYYLSSDNLFKLFDDVTRFEPGEIHKLNLIFDKTIKRFKLYSCKKWTSFLEDTGVKELVSLVKSYYLDAYEIYMIRNLHKDGGNLNRFKLLEHLEIYYNFIAVFDLMPGVMDFEDIQIVGHRLIENNSHHLAETYLDQYSKQKLSIKASEKHKIRRKLINIVKENTVHNISELNKAILGILQIDEAFRKEIVLSKQLM